jgi:alpha-beta hydrolase superfamily lysophospholipase
MKEEPLTITNNRGRRLAGIVATPDLGDPAAVSVLSHGMLSGKNSPKHIQLAEWLADRDVATLRFDFTSRYDSEGPVEEMTYTQGVEDLRAAVDVAREAFGPLPLGLYGSSMGGSVVLLYTARYGGVDAIATIAAAARPAALWHDSLEQEGLERWKREGWWEFEGQRVPFSFYEDAARKDVIAAAARVRCPLLLVHGARDEIVPVAQAKELEAAAGGPTRLVILPEADHRFSRPEDLRQMLQEVTRWLADHLV